MNKTIENSLLAKAQIQALEEVFSSLGDLSYAEVLRGIEEDSLPDTYSRCDVYEHHWDGLLVEAIEGFTRSYFATMEYAYRLNQESSAAMVEALQKVSELPAIQTALRSYEAGRFCDTDLRDAGLLVQAALAKAGVA